MSTPRTKKKNDAPKKRGKFANATLAELVAPTFRKLRERKAAAEEAAQPDTLWSRMIKRCGVDIYCIVPFEDAFVEACKLRDTYVLFPDMRERALQALRVQVPRVEALFEELRSESLIAQHEPEYITEKAAQVRGMRTWIDTPHLTLDRWNDSKH